VLPGSLVGCASVLSTPKSSETLGKGLSYYMPRKDFLITVTKADGKVTDVALATTEAYPDLDAAYVLNSGTNLVGKNQADFGIGTNGLLQSSHAVATSGIAEALSNLAESLAATADEAAKKKKDEKDKNCVDGTHTFIVAKTGTTTPCGVSVSIERVNPGAVAPKSAPLEHSIGHSHSGIYYRQAEPYLVRVTGSFHKAAILMSPNDAPIRYLPISRTFFANNDSTIELTDGMPTKYNETRDGELVGAFKLPATVIGAYFTAVGGIFSKLDTKDTSESARLASDVKLQLAKQKYEACSAAIKAKDDVLITSLECGK
jgi:hypothetical protein